MAATGTWPDTSRGYLGQPAEPSVSSDGGGYDDLGARKYDPVLGRFISADPVLEAGDPEQLGGYTYAADNPVAGSDPDGLELPVGYSGGSPKLEAEQEKQEEQQAEQQSIDDCGYHAQCAMSQARDFENPDYAAQAAAQLEAEQAEQFAIQEEELEAQAAAQAEAASSAG